MGTFKKKYGYALEAHVVEYFESKAGRVGLTTSFFIQSCMKAYSDDKFKMIDGEPVFEGTSHAPREPKKEPPKTKGIQRTEIGQKLFLEREAAKKLPPLPYDHRDKPVSEYPLINEPHIHVDPRPHLQWDTDPGPDTPTFKEQCDFEYMDYIENFTDREWQLEVYNFVRRVALKFLTINKLDLRCDMDTLHNGVYDLVNDNANTVRLMRDIEREAKENG